MTLRNTGTTTVALAGWTLRDRSGGTWRLSNGQAMSLNNGGDEVVLLDAGNVERDRVEYPAASEGVAIQTEH